MVLYNSNDLNVFIKTFGLKAFSRTFKNRIGKKTQFIKHLTWHYTWLMVVTVTKSIT